VARGHGDATHQRLARRERHAGATPRLAGALEQRAHRHHRPHRVHLAELDAIVAGGRARLEQQERRSLEREQRHA
jgi:hypothetical protein